jgi:hypothetical protein
MATVVKQPEAGRAVADMAREAGVSTYTVYLLEGEVRRNGAKRGDEAMKNLQDISEPCNACPLNQSIPALNFRSQTWHATCALRNELGTTAGIKPVLEGVK